MRKERLRACAAAVLAAAFIPVSAAVFPSYATNADIVKSKQTIDENKEKIDKLKAEQSAISSKISELKSRRAEAEDYIEELDRELSELSKSIQSLSDDIENTESGIAAAKRELCAAEERERAQYESMKLRMKYIYEAGDSDFLDSLFGAGSVADILNDVEYVKKVTEYDRKKLGDYAAVRCEIEEREAELSSKLELLSGQQAALLSEREGIEAIEAAKSAELSEYEMRIAEASEQTAELLYSVEKLRDAIREEENRISAIEDALRKKEEEAREKAESEGKTYAPKSIGDISFIWPVPDSGRVTSYFGSREAPVAGASTTHNGIDIGAISGAEVIASAGGTAVISSYSSSAGNYIMISHGSGIYTVYMHMKSVNVSEGDEVAGGQCIGYVGSTGYSTGPHLHFGIRVDGSYRDPLDYTAP